MLGDGSREIASARSLGELAVAVRGKLNCAGVLTTQITQDRQFVLANAGIAIPEHFQASMPLTHSICQHSVAMDFPLVIDDTIKHPLLKDNLAFTDLGVAAYLGAPVRVHPGSPLGAICALEMRYRRWTEEDIETIMDAAEIANQLIVRSL